MSVSNIPHALLRTSSVPAIKGCVGVSKQQFKYASDPEHELLV